MTAVGISIGASNSSVAVFKDGEVTILSNERGNKLTPSVVSFDDQALLCGEEAFERVELNPETTVSESKRMIGRVMDDYQMEALVKYWPFRFVSDEGRCRYVISREREKVMVTPEEVMAVLIAKMKRLAEEFVEEPVNEAVMTVPARFGVNQRLAIKHAGLIAGFQSIHLVNEATAVALAYVFDQKLDEPLRNQRQTVIVCNLGGGSTDTTTFTLKNNKVQACATNGCAHLGGSDYTNSITDFLAHEFKANNDLDIFQHSTGVMRLKNAAERAKKELGTRPKSMIRIDGLYPGFDYTGFVNKSMFEQILFNFTQIKSAIHTCIRDTEPEVEEVFMTGGSSRIPFFKNLVRDATGIAPDTSLHAEESPAIGAAVKAASISGTSANALGALEIVDVAPWSIKVNCIPAGDQVLFRRNAPIRSETDYQMPVHDNPQGKFPIKVYEGDNLVAANNTYLGQVIILLQEREYRPEERIRVVFEIDSCGILNVPRVELLPDHVSVDFTFERSNACLSEDRVTRCKERFPALGVRC